MTDLYFLKIFFIDKIIPYTLMTSSIAFLLLEMIAPKHIRYVFYDFSDRLFFKFIYRPISKLIAALKEFILFNLTKLRDLLTINQRKKAERARKRTEQRALRKEKQQQARIIRVQNKEIKKQEKTKLKENKMHVKSIKKEEQQQIKLIKKQEKLQNKLETKRLKNETMYKLKLFIVYKIKKLINKNQN